MPKNEENRAILTDTRGREVALKGVIVRARLHGLMAEVEVEQSYCNPRDTNIEAVYSFPLPLGAVLLGLEVEIAGRKLRGAVVEKKQAERDYEDAITDGNSAVMLEEAGPGLYTASLGNLMAGESAVIRYRYGLLLSWQGPRLRFLLPTTIAPRYGDAGAAGLRPHQVPVASLEVDYPLDLSVTVEGELAAATIASPSHGITVARSEKGMTVCLSGKPMLDRDFVLTLESETIQSSCVLTQDHEGHVALASLRIPPLAADERKPLALKVVIDCSGSMGGTSIVQARKAALEILNLLRPEDAFGVTLFGTTYQHLFPTLVPATARYITEAWNRLDKLDAAMGGTEMEKALDAVFALGGSDAQQTVLLITDGEIHEHERLVQRAAKSGHRVFTVGVGTSVAETFLKSLSRATQGACELVAPQEGMAERVLVQFHRMRQPKLGELHIEWPQDPEWQTALPKTVFAGDTVHVFAGFAKPVEGSVTLKVAGGADVAAAMALASEAELPRLAAARRMDSATDAESLRLALDYQLLSRWTNFLVIAERADKAEDLPELHQVPQMLAAGWGGTAMLDVCYSSSGPHLPGYSRTRPVQYLGLPANRHRENCIGIVESSLDFDLATARISRCRTAMRGTPEFRKSPTRIALGKLPPTGRRRDPATAGHSLGLHHGHGAGYVRENTDVAAHDFGAGTLGPRFLSSRPAAPTGERGSRRTRGGGGLHSCPHGIGDRRLVGSRLQAGDSEGVEGCGARPAA
ncbi:MAG: VWA domain-containing protein [Sulfuritalea sp.]|nr:VWA domain-containing protein [Sulfuritalea sp.]